MMLSEVLDLGGEQPCRQSAGAVSSSTTTTAPAAAAADGRGEAGVKVQRITVVEVAIRTLTHSNRILTLIQPCQPDGTRPDTMSPARPGS